MTIDWKTQLLQDFLVEATQSKLPVQDREGIHLSVWIEPYLTTLIQGKKTVESRFMSDARVPWHEVRVGDWVLVKQSSGPIVAVFQVSSTSYSALTLGVLDDLLHRQEELQVSDAFLKTQATQGKNRVCLFGVCNLHRFHAPVYINKSSRAGWVVLREAH